MPSPEGESAHTGISITGAAAREGGDTERNFSLAEKLRQKLLLESVCTAKCTWDSGGEGNPFWILGKYFNPFRILTKEKSCAGGGLGTEASQLQIAFNDLLNSGDFFMSTGSREKSSPSDDLAFHLLRRPKQRLQNAFKTDRLPFGVFFPRCVPWVSLHSTLLSAKLGFNRFQTNCGWRAVRTCDGFSYLYLL